MIKLTLEDIQAIATEVARQKGEKSTPTTEANARTGAQNNTQPQKMRGRETTKKSRGADKLSRETLANIVITGIWGTGLIILLIKVLPHIFS